MCIAAPENNNLDVYPLSVYPYIRCAVPFILHKCFIIITSVKLSVVSTTIAEPDKIKFTNQKYLDKASGSNKGYNLKQRASKSLTLGT